MIEIEITIQEGCIPEEIRADLATSTNDVSGHISEGPASWVMEGGHVLSKPGEEPSEWYQNDV